MSVILLHGKLRQEDVTLRFFWVTPSSRLVWATYRARTNLKKKKKKGGASWW